MDDRLRDLFLPSLATAPAAQANEAIGRIRREQGGGDPNDPEAPLARSYELVLSSWEALVNEALPRLVYHLESVGARLPHCGGMIVAAFDGDTLRFVLAKDLIDRVAKALGVSPLDLAERHGTRESHTAQSGPPLLLPGPGPEKQ
jgi:hypothetical protein